MADSRSAPVSSGRFFRYLRRTSTRPPRAVAAAAITAAATAVAMIGTAAPALADAPNGNTTFDWGNNDLVGCGGDTTGGYVAAAQFFFWGAGYNITAIDDRYGPQTANAIRFFQAITGLPQDGCAGPNTWRNMRTFLTNSSTNGSFEYISSSGRSAGFYSPERCGSWFSGITSSTIPVASPVNNHSQYKFSRSLTAASQPC